MTDTIREPQEILRVEHLSVSIRSGSDEIPVLRDVSFAIRQGERWAIAGESGAGKSMTMKAITALLPEGSTKISGRILFRVGEDGRWQDLLEIPYRERHRFVAEQIAIIFQDAINALNPNERIETQWGGTIRLHDPSMQGEALTAHMLEQMEIFGIRGGRVNMTERSPEERRHDFKLMECSMSDQEACQESGRCLHCDHFGYGIFKGGREAKW